MNHYLPLFVLSFLFSLSLLDRWKKRTLTLANVIYFIQALGLLTYLIEIIFPADFVKNNQGIENVLNKTRL